MNHFAFVGRISDLPVLKQSREGLASTCIHLDVERPFASRNGSFVSDRIPLQIYRGNAQTLCSCASQGDWICVQGRVSMLGSEIRFIAEKIEYIQ